MIKEWVEKARLGISLRTGVEGQLCFDPDVLRIFESAPLDVLPAFEAPPGYKWPKNPRGKDHPRYGRFVYAFATRRAGSRLGEGSAGKQPRTVDLRRHGCVRPEHLPS